MKQLVSFLTYETKSRIKTKTELKLKVKEAFCLSFLTQG